MTPGSTTSAVEKRQYQNNTLGWLGVVVLDPQGKAVGISVEPQGTVWLSDEEAILTARAPRDPKDNPFEETTFMEIVPGGEAVERKLRPLVPITEARFVPSEERYVPPGVGHSAAPDTAVAAANATGDEPGHATSGGDPVAAASAAIATGVPVAGDAARFVPSMQSSAPEAQTADVVPAFPGAAAQPAGAAASAESWVEPPGGVTHARGELAGENAPDPEPAGAPPTPPAAPPPNPGQAPNDQTQVAASGAETEEVAATATPDGEETGAAVPPAGEPPEGEFAANEEVGTPDAPAATQGTESA